MAHREHQSFLPTINPLNQPRRFKQGRPRGLSVDLTLQFPIPKGSSHRGDFNHTRRYLNNKIGNETIRTGREESGETPAHTRTRFSLTDAHSAPSAAETLFMFADRNSFRNSEILKQ